jgi:hypothetical protein
LSSHFDNRGNETEFEIFVQESVNRGETFEEEVFDVSASEDEGAAL